MSYRTILREKFNEAKAKNSQFSMRSLSRKIGIAPALLSRALSGKTHLSHRSVGKIVDYFYHDDPAGGRHFTRLHRVEVSEGAAQAESFALQSEAARDFLEIKIEDLCDIPLEIAYFAREFAEIEALTPTSLSRALKIKKTEAVHILSMLTDLGWLRIESGTYFPTRARIRYESYSGDRALREFNARMAARVAKEALYGDPKKRFFGTETLSFATADLPRATKILAECFEEIVQLSQNPTRSKRDSVFHLYTAFFDLLPRLRSP